MRIDGLEFERAVGLKKHNFSFRPDKLNIIIARNEFSKTLVAKAIMAILYGEDNNLLTCGKLRFAAGNRELVIARHFSPENLEVNEVTPQGSKPITPAQLNGSADDVGTALSGIRAAVFGSIAVPTDFGTIFDPTTVSELLARSTRRNREAESAIAALDERLGNYPFKGKQYKIEDLVSALARGREVLVERVEQLESERSSTTKNMAELRQVDSAVENLTRAVKCDRVLKLRATINELDSKIRKVQERVLYESELRRELRELGDLEHFPIATFKQVEEMWAKRQARMQDLDRLNRDIKSLAAEAQSEAMMLRNLEGLEDCTLEDAQMLYGYSRNLQSLQFEIEELQGRRSEEMKRLKQLGVDFDSLAPVRRQLLAMDSADLQEATMLVGKLREAKDELAESIKEYSTLETQLTTMRANQENNAQTAANYKKVFIASCSLPAILMIASFFPTPAIVANQLLTIRLFTGVIFVFALGLAAYVFNNIRRTSKNESERAAGLQEEQAKLTELESAGSSRIADLQKRLDAIAPKYNLRNGLDLSKNIQAYSAAAVQLKELDVIEQMFVSREAQIKSVTNQIEYIFAKAGRQGPAVTAEATISLADDIQLRRDWLRDTNKSTILEHRKSEQRFLLGEIQDIDSFLRDCFYKARLRTPEDVDAAYLQYQDRINAFRKWESVKSHLARVEQERAVELIDMDLNLLIQEMQQKRIEIHTQLQEMMAASPDVARLRPEEAARICEQEDMTTAGMRLDKLKTKQRELVEAVRQSSKNFDEYLPKTQNELEVLNRDLDKIRHNQKALELAKALLTRVSSEGKTAWSEELSVLSAELVQGAGLVLERVRWDESLALKPVIKGDARPVDDLSRGLLSGACRAELELVARVALARCVAPEDSLPLVLDEPFGEVDDEGFATGMRMLVSRVVPRNQVIILSCHQVRHQWLVGQLTLEEKSKMHFLKA